MVSTLQRVHGLSLERNSSLFIWIDRNLIVIYYIIFIILSVTQFKDSIKMAVTSYAIQPFFFWFKWWIIRVWITKADYNLIMRFINHSLILFMARSISDLFVVNVKILDFFKWSIILIQITSHTSSKIRSTYI